MKIIEKYKKKQDDNRHLELEDEARGLYQIREHNYEIWITYNGNLICPCSMMNVEPIDALKKMREEYVNRNL